MNGCRASCSQNVGASTIAITAELGSHLASDCEIVLSLLGLGTWTAVISLLAVCDTNEEGDDSATNGIGLSSNRSRLKQESIFPLNFDVDRE